jgi:hypothetical protein
LFYKSIAPKKFKMEVMNEDNNKNDQGKNYGCYYDENWESRHRMSKVFIGIAVLVAGTLLLMRQTGTEIPDWVLSWPMVLVVIGIATGIKHRFRRMHTYLILLLGVVFLVDKANGGFELKPYIWPIVIMVAGLFIILNRAVNTGDTGNITGMVMITPGNITTKKKRPQ